MYFGERQLLSWEVGHTADKRNNPEEYVRATVPGAVQLDWAKAKDYPSHEYADNYKEFTWMEDEYWIYQTQFDKPNLVDNEKLFFISKGIDYTFEIHINDVKCFEQEGMFTKVEVDITEHLKDQNTLKVVIFPIPKREGAPVGRDQASRSTKAPMSYGWDWHPRLVPSGIWDETFLLKRQNIYVESDRLDYNLDKDLTNASLNYQIKLSEEGASVIWKLEDRDGNEVLKIEGEGQEVNLQAQLSNINLWWPHDHGDPYLYQSTLQVKEGDKVLDEVSQKVGFRKVSLVMNDGAWDEPATFPKSRSVPPFTLEINGHKIFAKGTNWVTPEIFYGNIDEQRHREQLEYAKEINFNLMRSWGGGVINKDSFYEICDELGLMVWQEFPLACNPYDGDPNYMKTLEQEATYIVNNLRQHASVVLWCGGNELFNRWSGMTDQSLPLRLLDSVSFNLDPTTPFIMTSPVMGVAHGHYIFYDFETDEEVFQNIGNARNTAYPEFGMPSLANVEILKKIIPEEELYPPQPGTNWEVHHAFGSWQERTWLCDDILQKYFGDIDNLEELVEKSQTLQSVGYQCIYESARRQKPYCSMALNWCYNEPWPTAANNSLISYPNIVKPAYYAVQASCRPVLASAAFKKFSWKEGEMFEVDLWMLNDKYQNLDSGKVKVSVDFGDGQAHEILEWKYPEIEANTNLQGPTARTVMPEYFKEGKLSKPTFFKILLEVEGQQEWSSEYTLLYLEDDTVEVDEYALNQ